MNIAYRSLAGCAIALVALVAAAGAVAQNVTPRLFGATVAQRPALADAATVQARVVQPDMAAIRGLAREHLDTGRHARFVLDLFPGVDLEAEVISAEVRPNGHTVFARLTEIELGSALLTVEQGVLVGAVTMPGHSYAIGWQADGSYVVARKAAHLMPEEAPPKVVFNVARPDDPFAAEDVPADSGRLIDVMVVWTPAAQTAAGGAVAIGAIVQAGIDNANLVYLNSGIAQRLRLVHSQQVTYTERTSGCADPFGGPPGTDRYECALNDLTGTLDGQMDTVHTLRNTHGADLVALLIDRAGSGTCGLAWLPSPSDATQGFAIVGQDCVVAPQQSFTHELGHNMGAHHDPYVLFPFPADGCSDGLEAGAFCYSRGTVSVPGLWRTVLAYNNQCVNAGASCVRIQYMSNPNLSNGGTPLGNATARNNAHTLNKTAKAVAAYRPTSALHPVPQRFSDVATGHAQFGYIEFFAQAGITSGCGGGAFCPNLPVTREQMAAFIIRAKYASNYAPPAASGLFADVPIGPGGNPFAAFIEKMYADGITSGCAVAPLRYCPANEVTRAQMAAFILRGYCGFAYVPMVPVSQQFADVPPSHPFYRFIDKLARLGVTGGCAVAPLRYCPDTSISRTQMAVFVERAYPNLVPSEACTP